MAERIGADKEFLELAAKEIAARNERLMAIRDCLQVELEDLWKSWATPKKEKKVAKLSGADSFISDVIVEGQNDLVKIHNELGEGRE